MESIANHSKNETIEANTDKKKFNLVFIEFDKCYRFFFRKINCESENLLRF